MNEQNPVGAAPPKPTTILSPAIEELQTRFLHPFFFDRNHFREVVDALLKDKLGRNDDKARPVWACAKPQDFYQDELLENVSRYLFPSESGPCTYLQVTDIAQTWFRSTSIELPDGGKVHIHSGAGVGIELFLSSMGVGILSIKVSATVSPDSKSGLDCERAIDFNYRLAQHRRQDAPKIRKQHSKDDLASYNKLSPAQQQGIPEPPTKDAPLEQRLGAQGGEFDVKELAFRLLKPLEVHGLSPNQVAEFLVYTVARFGSEADFGDPAVRDNLAGFISGLAQVEEATHTGPPPGRLTVPFTLLNRRHWAAVGLLGAAHLIADQGGKGARFNELRPRIVSDKYFIPYLLALQQRLVLNRIVDETAAIVSLPRRGRASRLSQLREEVLGFAVEGHFMQVSSRHVLHRYYRLARHGLDVPVAWQEVRQAVADLDEQEEADRSRDQALGVRDNLTTITNVQQVVHTIEYLLASVYLAHLWHMLVSENHKLKELIGENAWDWFVSAGVLVFAGLGFLGVCMINRFIEHRAHRKSSKEKVESHPDAS